MKRERKPPFDPKVFLAKVNGGRAISDYRKATATDRFVERHNYLLSSSASSAAPVVDRDSITNYQVQTDCTHSYLL